MEAITLTERTVVDDSGKVRREADVLTVPDREARLERFLDNLRSCDPVMPRLVEVNTVVTNPEQ